LIIDVAVQRSKKFWNATQPEPLNPTQIPDSQGIKL